MFSATLWSEVSSITRETFIPTSTVLQLHFSRPLSFLGSIWLLFRTVLIGRRESEPMLLAGHEKLLNSNSSLIRRRHFTFHILWGCEKKWAVEMKTQICTSVHICRGVIPQDGPSSIMPMYRADL
jgi:hypothetical protein